MKKHILFSLAVLLMSVVGCTKPDNGKDNPQPPAPPQEQITIPSTVDVTPVVPPEGGDAKITFTAATSWTASVISTKADSWVDVNPKSGDPGPAEIKITTTPNDTYVERNATIQIKCGTETKDVVLTQKQVDNITVTTDKVELGAEGGTFSIELKSNIDFSYEIEGDWIKYVSTKAYTGKTLTFSAEPNEGLQKREGSVTVKGGEFSETIKVYQSGEEPTFIISQKEYEVEAEGGTVEVSVTSNIGYHATSSVDWIQELGTKANQGGTHIFRIEENKSIQKRTGAIVFCNDENVCVPVEIEQEGAAATISVSSSIVEFSSSSGEKTVEITSNAEWTVSQKPQWCTLSPSFATGSTSVRVSVTENGNTVPREGKIVFSAGNAIAELSVQQQAGEPELEVGDTELSFSGSGGVASFSIISNADWVVNTGVLWLKASAEEGTGNATVTLTAERNEKTEARTAQVTVRTKDGKISRTITVKQAEGEAFLELDVYTLQFDQQERCAAVKVTSNVSWSAVSSASWCTVQNIASGGFLDVCVKANDSGKSRSAIITVKADKGGLEKTVTVSQSTPEENEGFDDDGEIIWD